ncbi:MAG: leucine--tRNA ligase [Candidatus Peregrinibacteria bacterium]
MDRYDHRAVEKKWQDFWEKEKTFSVPNSAPLVRGVPKAGGKPKYYVLDMFPYPSGAGLHVGHPEGYTATDIVSRYKRMKGFAVLHPMGWDAFGLPAENYAIKTGTHPSITTKANIENFTRQIKSLGFSYDWDREINTTDPEYFQWTQWIFLQLYNSYFDEGEQKAKPIAELREKRMNEKAFQALSPKQQEEILAPYRLAYEKEAPINFCPSCKTGLANEEVVDGKCDRCGSAVTRKNLRQWMLRITKYAERLLEDLDLEALNWPEKIKMMQRNWIGRSDGMIFSAPVKDTSMIIQTFSAHFEAFCADTFVVIAPDHPLLQGLLEGVENKEEILKFCEDILEKRTKRGFEEEKEPEGIFTGRYICDPVGNGDLPIWIASFAIADYGTGIVKCSAHDERDFSFAKKYNIPLKTVLFPSDLKEAEKVKNLEYCFSDMKNGVLIEPSLFNGKKSGNLRGEIKNYLETHALAKRRDSYKIRDWVFSRQRYWGEPIPIIHCETCGTVSVPQNALPLTLPAVEKYEPSGTGESPLATIPDWVNTTCPQCGGNAKRETNTMPQWAGSSWYYLRFMDPKNSNAFCSPENEQKWGPVDLYVGGAEHAVLHLLYSRFWHKVLYDLGFVSTKEPFTKLMNQGLILAEDGQKMSKSLGNVVNPDEIVEAFGADTLRMYEMFMGPFEQNKAWNTAATEGMYRFLQKIWRLFEKPFLEEDESSSLEFQRIVHQTIKKIGDDIEEFKFNTAISQMMIFVNAAQKLEKLPKKAMSQFVKLISPFAPHLAEEMWHEFLGGEKTISFEPWPEYDPKMLVEDTVVYAVQINGKLRGDFETAKSTPKEEAITLAKEIENVQKYLDGKEILKEIFVPEKIVGFVVQ